LDLSATLQKLRNERAQTQQSLRELDKAIALLSKLGSSTGSGGSHRGRLSAAARERIAQAQRIRWAKWKAKNQKKAA
jgi:hypothetical protein